MKFSCPGCHAVFAIADEKIPRARGVKISCPKCGEAIELSHDDQLQSAEVEVNERAAYTSLNGEEQQELIPPIEVVEEGVKRALLSIEDQSVLARLQEIMSQLGYHVSIAENQRAALSRIKHNVYDLVAIDSASQGLDARGNVLLQEMSLLPIHLRRRFFVCLISRTLATSDFMAAYRIGLNLIINEADLNRAKIILNEAVKVHFSLYQMFMHELEKKGQL